METWNKSCNKKETGWYNSSKFYEFLSKYNYKLI